MSLKALSLSSPLNASLEDVLFYPHVITGTGQWFRTDLEKYPRLYVRTSVYESYERQLYLEFFFLSPLVPVLVILHPITSQSLLNDTAGNSLIITHTQTHDLKFDPDCVLCSNQGLCLLIHPPLSITSSQLLIKSLLNSIKFL